MGDGGADGGDDARGLVAEGDGGGEDEGADAAALPVVDVGAADAGLRDVDEDVVGGVAEGGDGAVLDGDGLDGGEDEGGVL